MFWITESFVCLKLCMMFVVLTLGIGMLIAWLPLTVVGLWFIYRIAKGWLRLKNHEPMYV